MKFHDGTSLWDMEQELRQKFPNMPEILIDPSGKTLGYFSKSYLYPAQYRYVNPDTGAKESKDTSYTIIIPAGNRIDNKELMRAILLHEIGHSQRQYYTDECIAASGLAAIIATYASTLHGKDLKDISLLNICLGILWGYISYHGTAKIIGNLEERRADNFMCQHADKPALQAIHTFHKKCSDGCRQYCGNNATLRKYLPRSFFANPDIAFHLYNIAALHQIADHPSYFSRMKKIEKALLAKEADLLK